MIRSILVLGGGSAGLLAALTLKRKIPALSVEVIYSSRIGVIGVGEGTVPYVPSHLHHYLGLDEYEVFNAIQPVIKLGVRFTWGKRSYFDYTFTGQQHSWRWPDLPRNNGFYGFEDPTAMDLSSALMDHAKALPRRSDGVPDLPPPGSNFAWHIENKLFVAWLEKACKREGVKFTDADLSGAETSDGGISRIILSDGSERRADFYIDASGFVSELVGKSLAEPFEDYWSSLFCDRAVAGGWDRGDEPILPYTLSDPMDSGWCWRIDHPDRIHRGYVFSSSHASDDQALEDYQKIAPKAANPRVVRFRSGRYRRSWIGNVAAVGNAAGFVEPLEATALMVICLQCRWLTDGLIDSQLSPNPSLAGLYNTLNGSIWSQIRDFLALHYKFNDKQDTPFWLRCRSEIPLNDVEGLVGFYQENGPSAINAGHLPAGNPFGIEGYLAILAGLKVPHARLYQPLPPELQRWNAYRERHRQIAAAGVGMNETLRELSKPEAWKKIRRK
ncbi:tryptophan 7-halogenase [Luteolibacter luteus]|uniref:Tryptophan 7-halogenase n=1 Tax=Luteolibacter luteus TaxID=2728835 RepID=A0A858RCT0_9BACT|nr:tryptophan 7-halogenase [Luteolibacter luteus]QJE94836.1 tryptophan 7-halogenase [Luteolibacter luteus]